QARSRPSGPPPVRRPACRAGGGPLPDPEVDRPRDPRCGPAGGRHPSAPGRLRGRAAGRDLHHRAGGGAVPGPLSAGLRRAVSLKLDLSPGQAALAKHVRDGLACGWRRPAGETAAALARLGVLAPVEVPPVELPVGAPALAVAAGGLVEALV